MLSSQQGQWHAQGIHTVGDFPAPLSQVAQTGNGGLGAGMGVLLGAYRCPWPWGGLQLGCT